MKYPFYNATAAFIYIVTIVGVLRIVESFAGDTPDNTFLAPIGALSLLVLSVATMAYLFFSTPLKLLLSGKDKEATRYLLHTIGYFALWGAAAFAVIIALAT